VGEEGNVDMEAGRWLHMSREPERFASWDGGGRLLGS